MDELLRDEASPDLLTADVYAFQGHELYILQGTNFSVAYDAATQLWHDWESATLTRWRGQNIVQFGTKWICGDNINGNLYELDPDVYAENGADFVMEMISPPFHAFPNRVQVNALWLDFAPGVGLNSTDDHNADPQVTLQVSFDGGKTFGSARTATLGLIGEYQRRIRFNRLGTDRGHGFVFKVTVSAQVGRAFLGAAADVEQISAVAA